MILPTKHLPPEASILGIGGRLLAALDHPREISELWENVRHQTGINSFDRFCTALTFLFVLGLIDLDPSRSMIARRQ
jgi:ABC-3C biological conflict system middle component